MDNVQKVVTVLIYHHHKLLVFVYWKLHSHTSLCSHSRYPSLTLSNSFEILIKSIMSDFVGFEVLIAAVMMSCTFSGIKPCNLLRVN
jgi:hypothetical protein